MWEDARRTWLTQGVPSRCAVGFFLGCITAIWDSNSKVLGREPTFDVPIVNVTVVAGQDAMLPCSIENLGKYQIAWMDQKSMPLTYEDRKIIDDTRFSVVRERTTEWTLMIREVTWDDRGEYRCTINTNPVRSKLVVLHVKVPATIIDELSSDDVIVKEGDTVMLVCNVTGIPKPTVTWYRQPVNSKGIMPKEKVQSNGEMLMIQNISRYCDSYYLCEANNGIPPKVTRQMKVTVEFAPEIRLRTIRIGQQLEKDTILECQITAYPMAVNYWQKDGSRIMSSTKYRLDAYDEEYHMITLSLRIMNIAEIDYGEYTCMANNRLGSDSETMKLYKIHNKPRMPTPPPSGSKSPFPVAPVTLLPGNGAAPVVGISGQYMRVDNKQPPYTNEITIEKKEPKSQQITNKGCGSFGSTLWLPLLWLPLVAMLSMTSDGRQL